MSEWTSYHFLILLLLLFFFRIPWKWNLWRRKSKKRDMEAQICEPKSWHLPYVYPKPDAHCVQAQCMAGRGCHIINIFHRGIVVIYDLFFQREYLNICYIYYFQKSGLHVSQRKVADPSFSGFENIWLFGSWNQTDGLRLRLDRISVALVRFCWNHVCTCTFYFYFII